jgi:hypothetical protein
VITILRLGPRDSDSGSGSLDHKKSWKPFWSPHNSAFKMPFLRPINLPLPLIAQSLTAVGLGLYLTLFRKPPFVSQDNSYSALAPPNPTPRTADTISLLGICMTGLEVTYLVSSYMPFEQNQFIAASVPVRLGLAALMAAVVARERKSMSKSGFWEFTALAALDGVSAVVLGWRLGRWDGMVAGAEGWWL